MHARTPVIDNLFCMIDDEPSSSPGNGAIAPTMVRSLRSVLPGLNHTSTCYLVAPGGLERGPAFLGLLDLIRSFLCRYTFLQISVRPVHGFRPDDLESWIEVYERFLLMCRPFQDEGYRQQIVYRLRIFPVLVLSKPSDIEAARPFLAYLRRNFFLPSILCPEAIHEEVSSLAIAGSGAEWERVLLARDPRCYGESILETLTAHAISDRILERRRSDPFSAGYLCEAFRLLDGSGTEKGCFFRDQGCGDAQGDSVPCLTCAIRVIDLTEASFRLDRREDAWREMCERVATGLQTHKKPRDAADVWERCLRGLPPDDVPWEHLLQKSLCRYEAGDLETAMTDLSELARRRPETPEVRFYMGLCEFGWRDYIEAADRFSEALDRGLSNPMRQEAEYLRGESHVHLEEYDEAMEALQKAELEGRNDSTLYFYQGLCLLGKGRPSEAATLLKKALERGPSAGDLFHVLFYIAHSLKEDGAFREALEYCCRAEALDPRSKELHNLKGFCHFKLKEHDAAIECFKKCIEIDPRSAIDYANIGSNLRDKGDMKAAADMYRKALSLDPTIDFARDNLRRMQGK